MISTIPFVVFSLPRSRSAWLSTVLCASSRLVGHDIGVDAKTPEGFMEELNRRGGTCETGASFAWRAIRMFDPAIPYAVVFRDPEEVNWSLQDHGFDYCLPELEKRYQELLEIAEQPNTFSCIYEDLKDSNIVARLYEHCTKAEAPLEWINKLQDNNIQISLGDRQTKLKDNRDQIVDLKSLVSKYEQEHSGYTLQVEPWSEAFWEEAQASAEAHFDEVDGGVEPNRRFEVDERIMSHMQDAGVMLIVVARHNGKFLGYFTWQIMPDVESKGLLIANQGAWYLNPGHPKVATQMFDRSILELKQRGVKCIFPHHRVQGRGANIGKFFKRRGAKLIQHTYSLWIGD